MVLQITALVLTAVRIGVNPAYSDFFLFIAFSQFLYFIVCSLLFIIAFLLSKSSAVSFILVSLYGAIDFIGTNTVSEKWFYIGTMRTFPPDVPAYIKHHVLGFSNIQFLFALIIALSVATILILHKIDFIRRNEGESDV